MTHKKAYKRKIASIWSRNDYDIKVNFRYYLMTDTCKNLYNISIDKYEYQQNVGVLVESESVHGVTESPQEAFDLVKKIAAGHVTPWLLAEILDELYSSRDGNTHPCSSVGLFA